MSVKSLDFSVKGILCAGIFFPTQKERTGHWSNMFSTLKPSLLGSATSCYSHPLLTKGSLWKCPKELPYKYTTQKAEQSCFLTHSQGVCGMSDGSFLRVLLFRSFRLSWAKWTLSLSYLVGSFKGRDLDELSRISSPLDGKRNAQHYHEGFLILMIHTLSWLLVFNIRPTILVVTWTKMVPLGSYTWVFGF